MSRKDIIIVASLINAGLLIVLFASALKSDGGSSEMVANKDSVVEEVPALVAQAQNPVVVGDEVDRALQQFVAQQATAPVSTEAAALSAAVPTIASASSGTSAPANPFVDDLKAIASQSPSVAAMSQAPGVQTLVAPMAQAQQLVPEVLEVKVKKGDVLEKIARHNHSSVTEIMRANNLKNANLRIGQVLKIPHHANAKATASATPRVVSNDSVKMYTVKKGDSPWTIAVKNQMKVEDLLKLNNMTDAQAKRLKPGDQLRIQ